jgi:hypothetical protein
VRLLDGIGSSVQLDDRFGPAVLLLPFLRKARRPIEFGSGVGLSGL